MMTDEQLKRIAELGDDPMKGMPEFAKIIAENAELYELAEMMEKFSASCQDYGWRPSEVDAVRLIMAKAVLAACVLEQMRKREAELADIPADQAIIAHDMWMKICSMADFSQFLLAFQATIPLVG